jgi:hypothetical protein
VLTLPCGAWEKGARRAALMAARGGVLDPRARGVLPLIGGQRWSRRFTRQVYGTGAGYDGDAIGRAAAWSARRGHDTRDTWSNETGPGWRCSARGGSTARGSADRGQPRRAGPAGPRHGRHANAGAGAALERQGHNPFNLPTLTGIFLQKFEL